MNKVRVRRIQEKSESPIKTPLSLNNVSNMNSSRLPAVRGVLVRFFRNGEAHHPGVKLAINEFELKSWEAFLNYLNKQPKLVLPSGGIQHVFTLGGREVRSLDKLEHRHSYVVASNTFIRTAFVHANDSIVIEEVEAINNKNRSRSITTISEHLFILPYSQLSSYETLLFNRSSLPIFDRWLNGQVTDLLSRYLNDKSRITHLYAVTKSAFTEVLSFSQLFNSLKSTDTFIACNENEFEHSKEYLKTVRPVDFLAHSIYFKKSLTNSQKHISKSILENDQLVFNWVYGYDSLDEQRRNIHRLADNEILYAIGSICIIYQPISKKQRFYWQHNFPVTHLSTHRAECLVASSEIVQSKDRSRVLIHIWNSNNLTTLHELRHDQFGNQLSLISLNETLLLVVSKDKPKVILGVDWKHNELIFSITNKTDPILSALCVFNSNEWIACVTVETLTFYQLNWDVKPIRLSTQREADVQNVYTGAICCYDIGNRVIVGDKVGNIYLWELINEQPKMLAVKEMMLESDVLCVGSIDDDDLVYVANSRNQVLMWNTETNQIDELRIEEASGSIRSVCCLRQGVKFTGLVIGTNLNNILFKQFHQTPIEVIACGPLSPATFLRSSKDGSAFFSVVDDRVLSRWDKTTRSIDWSVQVSQNISCIDVHPERNIIMLGTKTSKLLVYDTLSSFYISSIPLKARTTVKTVQFSPDGFQMAVGLENGTLQIYDVAGNGDFRLRHEDAAIQNDNIAVISIVWSVDSKNLLSIFNDNHYSIWLLPSFTVAKDRSIENILWQSMGHPIISGILDQNTMDTQASVITLSPNTVLCCGKDGQIRLFRNQYERQCQTLPIGWASVQTVVPSNDRRHRFLVATDQSPSIIEVQINGELEGESH